MAKTSAAPNSEILQAALTGLEAQKQKIDDQIAQVRAMMGKRVGRPPKDNGGSSATATKSAPAPTAPAPGRKKRSLSPEARKRIAAAQKKRWANFRKTQ